MENLLNTTEIAKPNFLSLTKDYLTKPQRHILFRVVFMVVLFSLSSRSFSQNVAIEIGNGNVQTGDLELRPSVDNGVYQGGAVIWYIGASSHNVKSFKIKHKDNNEHNIFKITDPPPRNYTTWGVGTVKKDAEVGWQFRYKIVWLDTDDVEHTMDPILSVNPSLGKYFSGLTTIDEDFIIVGLVICLVAVLVAFVLYYKKRKI